MVKAMKSSSAKTTKKSMKSSSAKTVKKSKSGSAKTAKKSKSGSAKTAKKSKGKKSKSIIARGKLAKSAVYRGTKQKTSGGLEKNDLVKNRQGKIVSKKASDRAKKAYKLYGLDKWSLATKKARKALNIKGFVPIGGKTPQGQAFYKKAKSFFLLK